MLLSGEGMFVHLHILLANADRFIAISQALT